jgi:hypothetical protein
MPVARVELAELHAGVVTDTAGAFAFAGVPEGRFTLVVRRFGYATELREVHAGGASLMIGLRESPVPIEAVTVTATRSAIAPLAHFIHLTPSDPPATSGELPVFEYRAVDATLWGGEAALTVEPAPLLSVFGRTDFVRATENATGEPLPLIPPLRTGVGAELHASHIAWAERLYLGADAENTARKTRLSPRESPAGAEGYTLYHLSAGVARRLFGCDARMDVRVRNLTDVRYRDFLSRYKEFALSAGRNAVVGIAVER